MGQAIAFAAEEADENWGTLLELAAREAPAQNAGAWLASQSDELFGAAIRLGLQFGVDEAFYADLFEGAAHVEHVSEAAAELVLLPVEEGARARPALAIFCAFFAHLLDLGVPLSMSLMEAAAQAPSVREQWSEDLVHRVETGDELALYETIDKLPDGLNAFVRTRLGTGALAEDLRENALLYLGE